jgi:hypothetical protein
MGARVARANGDEALGTVETAHLGRGHRRAVARSRASTVVSTVVSTVASIVSTPPRARERRRGRRARADGLF